jgi:glutamate-ammonia-ligase adenylyltransferase
LIKARHSAGDLALAREFIRGVQPRVYTPNINFAAIETAVNSRDKIGVHRRRTMARRRGPGTTNVKLDRGGIREIEFLVQCLQRVYGGEESWLRAGETLFSLQKLNDKGHLDAQDFHELSQAYEFLRAIEHRLQLQRGQQLHSLPGGVDELAVLARAVMGDSFAGPSAFAGRLRSFMARVAAIYDRTIYSQKQREKRGSEVSGRSGRRGVRESSLEQMLERIGADSTALRDAILRPDLSVHARRNLHRFLSAAMTSPERHAVLVENPDTIGKAIVLFETSGYLTDILVRHPDAVRVLNQLPQSLGPLPAVTEMQSLVDPALSAANPLALLRKNYRERSFVVAAQDIVSPRPAFLSMQENSRLADRAIQCALRMVQGEQSLAVFALGRLGTDEFDVASDADLLFVRAPEADEDEARLDAERLVNALAAYTKEGSIFAVDARLRPHGGEGELVVSAAQMERYLAEEAQPWEALSYSKLRFVAGRKDLAPLVLTAVWHQIIEIAARPGFPAAVLEMRAKLEKSNRYPHSFKLARGGLYDIDFIASYVMLREASLASGNTLERLEALREGLLDAPDLAQLRDATLLYRTADHAIRLVTGRARPELPAAEHPRQAVETMINRILGRQAEQNLQTELQKTQEVVRKLFAKIIRA